MANEHLHPNRAWTLIRDGGQFTPAEADHLKECQQCGEWLSHFSNLARTAGFKPNFESPFFFLVEDQHLTAGRAWSLIRDGGALTLPEVGHLHCCQNCNDWLTKFVSTARSAGFSVTLEIPACDSFRAS